MSLEFFLSLKEYHIQISIHSPNLLYSCFVLGADECDVSTKSKPVSDTHCLICLDNHSDSVLYQCGHMCVCYPCGRYLMSRGSKCPVCRAPIKDIIRAYKSNEN